MSPFELKITTPLTKRCTYIYLVHPTPAMIDPGKVTYKGEKGDVICRPSHWSDVAMFFLANYALHAFTVLTDPGSGAFITMCDCVRAILLPYTGSVKALIYISEFAIGGKTTLERAKRARALCMVVPTSVEFGR